MADFNMARGFDLTYATAYYNRGVVNYERGNRDAGLADYGRAIELDPWYFNARYNRGIVRKEKGDLRALQMKASTSRRLKSNSVSWEPTVEGTRGKGVAFKGAR
jgi:tetratricopeptide (TPR) repeat protein